MKTVPYFVVMALLVMATACGKPGKKEDKNAKTPEKIENVRATPMEMQEVARTIEYTATLLAYEEIHMAPASPGRVESIPVEVGMRVSNGTLLAQMDRTQLQTAETQLMNLENDFRRLDTLQKVGSVAKQQYDQLKTQLEVARTNVDFLRRNVKLVAPFSGVISGKYFEAGEMYSGAPNTMAGKAALVSLVQIDKLKLLVPVSEKYFPQIRNGMTARVVCDIYPGKEFSGKVVMVHPTIDPGSRTFQAEVVLSNPGGLLRPGMFTRVGFDLEKVEAMLLPAIAVLKMQGSNDRYLFVADQGKARRVSVTMGNRYNDLVEVFSDDLKKGDLVIVSGQARLLDGMKINIVEK
ncbi:MAG TPA: efflux RND transporter periplasmic adaptor subunit [Bacteroidales bacterium]|nr:efflux RND transporter periplasmic adaptor subunit [Bacteroidales bacterium]HRZ48241.1 efflux RND transporter periplasmic adaptor subunit [Bacteroidales bacterium]